MKFRVGVTIRVMGKGPFDWYEIKSENFDSIEEYTDSIKEMLTESLTDYLEGSDGHDETDTGE